MKLFNAIAAAAVLGASFIAANPANATIWADLDAKEVMGKNDGIEDVYVTRQGRTQKMRNPNAAFPLKGKIKSKKFETAKMTKEGEKYYLKLYSDDIAREKAFALGDKNRAPDGQNPGAAGGCPPGKQFYRTKGLFGIGARDLGCMTAYEAESLRTQNVQNFQNNFNRTKNCTTSFIGNTAYTNCY
tara:strand:- start:666 stop:1223 length:558 start_codon:yes stop_codon:yes gene_type:complete